MTVAKVGFLSFQKHAPMWILSMMRCKTKAIGIPDPLVLLQSDGFRQIHAVIAE